MDSKKSTNGDFVTIHRQDLQRLIQQVNTMKDGIPKLARQSNKLMNEMRNLEKVEQELYESRSTVQTLQGEVDHWKAKYNGLLAQQDIEREEKFKLKCEIVELNQQVSQQSDYCSSMGAACCTLLWRVSRVEDTIQSMLAEAKIDDFLQLVGSTVETFSNTYKNDTPQPENSEETQFVLSLCGIVTNIAASSYGRDFLMTKPAGSGLVDTFINVLAETPRQQCPKMKNLILMSLFNISINQKGLKHLSSKNNIMALLVWLLTEESEPEIKLHSIRLIQSLVYEQNNVTVIHQIKEVLPKTLLQQLSTDRLPVIREAAIELGNDLTLLQIEI
ncbi:unnamed protein product [Owenia fusiformis]|uniref:Uncharacterized protein n=1 Tax=Owenia fusiformis TaxID=6347 RepID=A0A8J1XUD9_OWEFU|nr:unnamed protein product [Owenia fusiformis]